MAHAVIKRYLASQAPTWVDQRPAMVGSNVRTVSHNGSSAGLRASWIKVKQG
jgi:hypothetical protein